MPISHRVDKDLGILIVTRVGQVTEGEEDEWTGTGFPRVFYMKYHYYRHYWPLMALLQYRRHIRGYRP